MRRKSSMRRYMYSMRHRCSMRRIRKRRRKSNTSNGLLRFEKRKQNLITSSILEGGNKT